MKILLTVIMLLSASSVWAQYKSTTFMFRGAKADTLVGSVADTTEPGSFYPSSTKPIPGNPCFEVYWLPIGTNTDLDSLTLELWVGSNTDNLEIQTNQAYKRSSYWCKLKSWTITSILGGAMNLNGGAAIIVADTLTYVTAKDWRWIITNTEDAADSIAYYIVFDGDEYAQP